MRLDVCAFCPEEGFRPLDSECFNHVDIFAATIVALSWITLGIFVCQYRTLRLQNILGHAILRSNQLNIVLLPVQLLVQYLGYFWIN